MDIKKMIDTSLGGAGGGQFYNLPPIHSKYLLLENYTNYQIPESKPTLFPNHQDFVKKYGDRALINSSANGTQKKIELV